MTKKISVFVIVCLSIISCNKDKIENFSGTYYESGTAIVVNEGNFSDNNASVSFIDNFGKVQNFIYEAANGGINLGSQLQSYTKVGTKGILCVSNSQKIEIVDARTFKRLATIVDTTASQNTNYVRYSLAINDSIAYISNGNYAGKILVLNLSTYKIINTIQVGFGPEQMALVSNNVYVCNSGGFSIDSTISVINTTTQNVIATIKVGDIPTKIVKDVQGFVWILCAGQSDYSNYPIINKLTPAKLIRINTINNTVDRNLVINNAGNPSYVVHMAIGNNGRTIYYAVNNKIYSLDITASILPTSPIIEGREFYGLSATPYNNQIWGLQAPNFSSSGYVFRFKADGTLIDSLKVGIGPNAAVFNN